MKTRKVPFDIYIPATEHREAIKVHTIRIDLYTDDFGSERVTPASTQLIEKTQARYMGLLAAEDIRAVRQPPAPGNACSVALRASMPTCRAKLFPITSLPQGNQRQSE
jgi:hypothetical protein